MMIHLGQPAGTLPGRMIITEMMPDPTPSVGLPEAEYIELWNPGPDPVPLLGWVIQVGDKKRALGTVKISELPAGGFLLLCSESSARLFEEVVSLQHPNGSVHPLDSWPVLPNTGARVTLITPDGCIMHSVEYAPENWIDALKANGGWSLELIDPDQYCRDDNWAVSMNPRGGTPGEINSVTGHLPPGEPPHLIRAMLLPDNRFGLRFSGQVDPLLSPSKINCMLYPGALSAPMVVDPGLGSTMLCFELPDQIDTALRYKIQLDQPIYNCSGQMALAESLVLAFPQPPGFGDIIINEIMFDPCEGEPEWIELYNRSEKVIEIADLIIAKGYIESEENQEVIVTNYSNQQNLPFQLLPNSYCILSPSSLHCHPCESRDLLNHEQCNVSRDLLERVTVLRKDLPALSNSPTTLVLMDQHQQEIDRALYSPDMHYFLIRETKGVSLERISPESSGYNQQNWFSAANGNSAGGQNSNTANESPEIVAGEFQWINKPGIPVVVTYSFPDPGWFARIWIYDRFGHPVREVSGGAVIPREGVIQWNGLSDRQTPQPADIYVMVVDYMHPDGRRGRWRSAIALHR